MDGVYQPFSGIVFLLRTSVLYHAKTFIMKTLFSKKILVVAVAAFAISFYACHKSDYTQPFPDPGTDLPTAPETKPAYNNTSFGVYKGVVVGSTGTIVFRINNGDNVVKGYLVIDDVKDTLSTIETLVPGQAITDVLFTGRISSMRLSVYADGTNASLSNISIVGHNNVTIFIIHENSDKQVLLYEGTYSGYFSGTLNCTRVGANSVADSAYVLAKVSDTLVVQGFGAVINNSVSIKLAPPFDIQGSFSGDNFNGTWSWTNAGTGIFTCTRTF